MADQMTTEMRASWRADEDERDGGYRSGGERGTGYAADRLAGAGTGRGAELQRPSTAPRLTGPGLTEATRKAVAAGKGRPSLVAGDDAAAEGLPTTWFSPAQMSREAARALFDYRPDGRLFWRDPVGRRHPEAGGELYRKRLDAGPIWTVHLGSRAAVTRYMRRYLVWNWHFGGTDRVLLPRNGDTLDDRIDNIRLGARLQGFAADAPAVGGEAVPATETGVTCPCCGALAPVLSPNLIARAYELPPQQEAILTRVWQGKGKPVTGEAIIGEMYADDFDGGPEYETARKYFKTQLCLLRKRIEGSGVRIEAAGYQRGFKLVLGEGGKPASASLSEANEE
ncbi:hypothetical protein [Pleomorphomonas oryzae]|uniref:hypothetical protein n=1 Tax=Pleomorphomonas oryzae TaxID=261934 RepID=UPI0003FD453A|nr:hypothetical protein [Pleomorphomonas oryzae]